MYMFKHIITIFLFSVCYYATLVANPMSWPMLLVRTVEKKPHFLDLRKCTHIILSISQFLFAPCFVPSL